MFTEQHDEIARPRGLLTTPACWSALGQLHGEHASVLGLARQLGTTWRTVWRSILPLLEAGRWEGDLILGLGCASAMMTLRERTTQYGIIVNLPHDHTAISVNAAVSGAFAELPPHMKRTLTWDQGVEMAKHQDLATASGVPIYFAERCSPWQRGANENFNGLARQYYPKGTDLAVHSAAHVAYVTAELNDRPRKSLGYDTPAFRFAAESAHPPRLG